ncbi:Metal-sulfur cluster biosynthetic enzyme (PaaD) [Fructobacillus tropaeoli]|uniref:metal-sulfur cluster assembly factor n=1 Tax=Fructobacillus tropaeoli TaxID=709323 RepID=UPI002DA676C0|nr:Metal-sulfur cluster biosynthetic enzyme (PaaD) [Fructobacillus tropaeoli]
MANQKEMQKKITTSLSQVIDPELKIDIVNLGLINQVTVQGNRAIVDLTLTTLGCPLTKILENDIRNQLLSLSEIQAVEVVLTWEPAWHRGRLSPYARIALGL